MEGLLSHMKLDHYSQYSAEDTARAESALLSVWAALGNLTDEIVLVGEVAGVSAVYGVSRALAVNRRVRISGYDLQGARVAEEVRVCEVGPYLCLKLQAYAGRAQGKDVFDVVRAVRDYDGGSEAAAVHFHAERGKNLAYEPALRILRERFEDARSKGPTQYASFCMPSDTDINDAQRRNRIGRVNEALDAAHFLLSRGVRSDRG